MEKKPDPHLIDDENPEWTEEMFQNAKRGPDALRAIFGQSADSLINKKAGRPKSENPKQLISFRFDAEIVEHLKHDVVGYNRRVEALIRDAWQRGQL